jgi:hypothetical protein
MKYIKAKAIKGYTPASQFCRIKPWATNQSQSAAYMGWRIER